MIVRALLPRHAGVSRQKCPLDEGFGQVKVRSGQGWSGLVRAGQVRSYTVVPPIVVAV